MLSSIFHAGTFSAAPVAAAMASALVLGIVIAVLYKNSAVHIGSVTTILAVLPLLVASVIMIVNGNLGTSVAVLGAFGLVRFRSAPGSAREIGFIFFRYGGWSCCWDGIFISGGVDYLSHRRCNYRIGKNAFR